jgi:general secretion pathway protein G
MTPNEETHMSTQQRRALRALAADSRGLTLVEIMIVLTIMASIMGMVGVFVVGAMDRAKVKEAETQVGQYASFVEEFYVYTGNWPDSLDQLETPPRGVAPFVERINDDPWGSPYQYRKGGRRGYELCSNGPDGATGGGDDICAGPQED